MLNKKLTFGEKIKELRLKQGLSQTQVATAVGVAPQAYSRWERNERQPAYELLAELLSVLGNPEFKIHDKKVMIENHMVKPHRQYLEIPSYEEIVTQLKTVFQKTQHLKTFEALKQFAMNTPHVEIKINGEPLDGFETGSQIKTIRYKYKNVAVYAHLVVNEVLYSPMINLYDDKGNYLKYCPYLKETDYLETVDGMLQSWPGHYTLNQDYQFDANAGHPLSINLTKYPIQRYSAR